MRVLSTKILSASQKDLLLNAGADVVEYDAISIEQLPFHANELVENAIFTSKNAVKAVLDSNIRIENCFCVGEKTKQFLTENGQKVVEMEQNASDLGQNIVKNYKNNAFVFFCGTKRLDELPNILSDHQMGLKLIEVYKTDLTPKKIEGVFDGILFFSPSAVESFAMESELKNTIAFCIGETTAKAAKKHTKNIVVAGKPSIEKVLGHVVEYINKLKAGS